MPAMTLRALGQWVCDVGERLATPRGFFLFTTAVMVVLCLVRAFLFPGTGGDDSEQLVFAQSLEVGYFARNPPLYTWLVIAVQAVLGVSVLSVVLVKFVCLWGTCVLLYAAGRGIGLDDRLAALAGLSPLGLYFVVWDAVTGLTDSALVMTLCVVAFLVLLRLERSPHIGWYLAFGVVAGLGLLSKYGFGVFLLSLLAAALVDAPLRRRLVSARSLAALAAMAIVVAPFAIWFAGRAGETMATDTQVAFGDGLLHLVKSSVGFLSPLWALLLLCFPGVLRRAAREPEPSSRWRHVIALQLVAALAIYALVIAASGVRAREYYMFVLILFPLLFLARVEACDCRVWAPAWFACGVAAVAVAAAAALTVKAVAEPLWCDGCQRHLPYDAWVEELRALGGSGGTIVADWYPHPLAGNLRIRLPEARVVTLKHASYVPPPAAEPGPCLMVWTDPARGESVIDHANTVFGAGLDTAAPASSIAAPIRYTGRKADLHYLLIEDGAGDCR